MILTWEAENLENQLKSGRTKPLVIECSRAGHTNQTFVVKAVGLPEVTQGSLFQEIFGNLLARELGVNTPDAALINLGTDFVASVNRYSDFKLHLVAGIGAGSKYFKLGFNNITAGATLTTEELAQAALIYGFDLIAQNPDRRTDKPNCAMRSGQLMAYDFEMSFSFLLPILGKPAAPWEFSQHGIAERHLFRAVLMTQQVDWSPLTLALKSLNAKRLKHLVSTLPDNWAEPAVRVCEHFLALRNQSTKLAVELARSLR